jgi:YD repeat-containing protein
MATTVLFEKDTVYNVEDKPSATTTAALPSTLTGAMDKVKREYTFDIFGNSVTFTKTTMYGDGRQYTVNGPISLYDGCNRLIRLTNQLGQAEINTFNADGRLISMTRYDGSTFLYSYDPLGQKVKSVDPDGATLFEYLPNGKLSKITKNSATTVHIYAPDGSIMSTRYPDDRVQTYTLDVYSRVSQEIDAAGRETQNSFDNFGRISSKTMGDTRITYQFDTVNHTKGTLVSMSTTGTQPYTRQFLYDGFSRRKQLKAQTSQGAAILNVLLDYDSRGRVVSRQVS